MRIIRKKVLAVLLSMVMALTMLVALPTSAHAATASIDVSSLTSTQSNLAGDAPWTYDHTTKLLTLSGAGDTYTLSGTNADLRVTITGANATIRLDAVDIASNTNVVNTFTIAADCTLTLLADSIIKATGNNDSHVIYITSGNSCTINGGKNLTIRNEGLLYAHGICKLNDTTLSIEGLGTNVEIEANGSASIGIKDYGDGGVIYVGVGAELGAFGVDSGIQNWGSDSYAIICDGTLVARAKTGAGIECYPYAVSATWSDGISIGGSGRIIAISAWAGTGPAIDIKSSFDRIYMDDTIELWIQNHNTSPETHTFIKSSGVNTHMWDLTTATTSDSLLADTITVTVSAGGGPATYALGVIKRVPIPPTPPTITSAASVSFVTGTGGSFPLTAAGTAPITFGLSGTVPAGVSVSGSSLVVAAAVAPATYNFTVTATNGTSPDATQAFTLTVTAAPVPPTITSAASASFVTGTGGSFPLTATGTTPITFGLSGTVPVGVSISGSSLVVASTVAAGDYNFVIVASNAAQSDVTQQFTLNVTAADTGGNTGGNTSGTPATGDSTTLMLLLGALLAAALGTGAVFTHRRRGQEDQ